MQKTTTFLMFDGKAKEAIDFYVSLFPNSEILDIQTYAAGEPGPEGTVKHATFTLAGTEYMAIDSNMKHMFGFTPAISIFVTCETVEEIDALWEKLSEGGEIKMALQKYPFSEKFGWTDDRFGVSWQLGYGKVLKF